MTEMETPIARVRGLGSAKTGSHHWLLQRFTAIGNLVLVLWLVVSLLMLKHFDYQTVREWLVRPVPATAMPPCAATVWLRVGKTLVMHAVLSPLSAMPMVARRPLPPAPTTTAS